MEHYGKFRGKVTDNQDPLGRGRIRAMVPAISDKPLTWAEPCTPYAGPKAGWYALPPVGANVWIEFERGDPDYPIWSGCFWASGDPEIMPLEKPAPEVKLFQTEKMALIVNDKDKEERLTVKLKTDDGELKLVMDKAGIVLSAGEVTLTVSKDKIELKKGPATIELAEAIALKKAAASLQVSDSIALKNGGVSVELSASAVNLKNGASSVALSSASVSINNGALEVT
jgi:uncharacterized protein involved in type VI secretion and phage assembly